MHVYFTDAVQAQVDSAVNVRLKDADVVTVTTTLEPVPFNKGFYSVDITFFFDITLDLYTSPGAVPITVQGVAVFNKKVILFGSDGSVKVFTSEYGSDPSEAQTLSLPRVNVQVAKPIALSARIGACYSGSCVPCRVPQCVCNCVGGEPVAEGTKCVTVTLGLFSIVQIERNVQMLVKAYDFCIPKKECTNSTDNPCEVFSRLEFPKDQFFPPNIFDKGNSCGCS
ncbi:MAG: hypothetical protein IJF52_06410 [Clostridia bacterium]|nr:hypothetical protein [Clostridia bacterium]